VRRFDLEAMPLEQTGIDRNEQRKIRKGAAVRQEQFSHRRRGENGKDFSARTGVPDTSAQGKFSEDCASEHRFYGIFDASLCLQGSENIVFYSSQFLYAI
jgi:hypothetical protein